MKKIEKPKKSKKLCAGCTENFYNGNNSYGVKECWNFKSARVIKRKAVPIWQRPLWNMPMV
jgi:hypothetical protein